MPIYLKALSLKNYRGIGDNVQRMSSFKSFNFFIGANNAGKSTVLNFISRYLPPQFYGPAQAHREAPYKVEDLERHEGKASRAIEMALGIPVEEALTLLHAKYPDIFKNQKYKDNIVKFVKWISDDDMIWKESQVPYKDSLSIKQIDISKAISLMDPYSWNQLWAALVQRTGGNITAHWIPEILKAIDKSIDFSIPRVSIIPAIRQIGPKGDGFDDYSGVGLIDKLASIQNPDFNRRGDRAKFDKINGFLQYVTGKSEAAIEIPHSREHVLVHMDDRVLPLSSLGTGIHEVVMIAAFCTISEKQIVCIEEPEIHLHPLLQRKLIRYLSQKTDNQYFIATHSASFIDTPDSAIFHVYQDSNKTYIREAILKKERYAICLDLGHRASDIVQSNAIIWVEGPSDRIYLNHWLKIFDNSLVEGLHYSIMFYGGRLLSHLAADDADVSEFIQLRDLNRNVAILMDSDKEHSRDRINETKRRLQREFAAHGGVAWITKGREVENYIEYGRLQRAVATLYGEKYASPLTSSAFGHALHFLRSEPKRRRKTTPNNSMIETDVDKVKVSRILAADASDDLSVLDLEERVGEVVAMIRKANS